MNLVAVLAPVVVAVVIVLVRLRRGTWVPAGRRGPAAAGLILLAFGAGVWLLLAGDEDVDLPWLWIVGVVLGLVAVLAALRPGSAGLVLWFGAAAAPILAFAGMMAIYVFGDGVSDGAGGTEPASTMAVVALLGALGAFSFPAVVVGTLLRYAGSPPALAPEGWYPVPDEPGTERRWDGAAWTDEVRHSEPPKVSPSSS